MTSKLLGRAAPEHNLEPNREMSIVTELFPRQPPTDWSINPLPPDETEHTLFTANDVSTAARRLPSGKAAESDGIISEVHKAIAIHKPEYLIQPFNNCLISGIFPSEWKEARLVLLHEGGDKDPKDPSSFRPISVINSAGKLMETHFNQIRRTPLHHN